MVDAAFAGQLPALIQVVVCTLMRVCHAIGHFLLGIPNDEICIRASQQGASPRTSSYEPDDTAPLQRDPTPYGPDHREYQPGPSPDGPPARLTIEVEDLVPISTIWSSDRHATSMDTCRVARVPR